MRCLYNLNTPKILGYLGLLPFVALTLLLLMEPNHQVLYRGALLSYGAVILTFIGALHWAFAMQAHHLAERVQRGLYVWSVIPSLVAWLALLLQCVYAYVLLMLFFALALWRDVRLAKITLLADWYLPLRKVLTCVVMSCLLLALLAEI